MIEYKNYWIKTIGVGMEGGKKKKKTKVRFELKISKEYLIILYYLYDDMNI